ncbi:MAG: GTPase Era [Clostridia bacterium]|nr:GTPase Era [Clostridia bacterium]
MQAPETKSAFIAIVGCPNVGKSSLLNRMVGQKVAIVSDKPQTTRTRIMGVLTEKETQLVFLDTPGLHRPRTRLGDFMVKSIGEAVSSVDAAMLVVEPTDRVRPEERELIAQMKQSRMPAMLVINKTDLVKEKTDLLACIAAYKDEFPFEAVIPVSAVTGEGVDELKAELRKFAVESPHFFPEDTVSDQPERVLASELIREQILRVMRDEVPHGVAVVTEQFKEGTTSGGEPIVHIDCIIYCERESHKGMLIGKGGARLKAVSSAARREMEDLLGTKVDLKTWIKVKEDWRNRQGLLTGFGYQL